MSFRKSRLIIGYCKEVGRIVKDVRMPPETMKVIGSEPVYWKTESDKIVPVNPVGKAPEPLVLPSHESIPLKGPEGVIPIMM